VKPIWTSQGQ